MSHKGSGQRFPRGGCGTLRTTGRPNWLAVAPACFYSPGMSRRAVYFLIGFIVGAVVSLLWNTMPIMRAGAAPFIPGIWLDIAVQAVIIGLLLGLVVMLLGAGRRNRS